MPLVAERRVALVSLGRGLVKSGTLDTIVGFENVITQEKTLAGGEGFVLHCEIS